MFFSAPQNDARQGSIVHSARSFFFIAPEVRCLDIVWVIIPPRSSHPFGMPMVWHDVVVVRELFVADGALPVLLRNLSVQKLPHL